MFSISHLIVVLVIVVLLFGTGKLKTIGTDLGTAIKGFKKAVSDDDTDKDKKALPDSDKPKSE
ncbi:MAG TPA: twin-arginine translocase TatA/TatE family subunit [Pseudomonadales bacterium]|nr:twin-arginine translocase TatA/TatE family subunit [Pseudomonadales bacterium]